MPPLALISSAAICAPPGVAAPAIDCTSAMTPILIGSLDCAEAGEVTAAATSAVVAIQKYAALSLACAIGRCSLLIRLAGGFAQSRTQALWQINRIESRAMRCKIGRRRFVQRRRSMAVADRG